MRTATLALTTAIMAATPLVAHEALVGATVIDGTGRAIENGVVLVDEDRIACVGTAEECAIPEGTNVHDVTGSFVTPGLIDAHMHFAQTGWIDGRPDGIEDKRIYPYEELVDSLRADPGRWHRSYLCSGVTAVFDVGGAPWTVTDPHATDTDWVDRVHVKAAGPLITHYDLNRYFVYGSLEDQVKFWPMESEAEIRADIARLKALGSDAIKVWFIRPEPDEKDRLDALLMAVGAAATANGLPLIVHATELEGAKTALKAGAKMLVHSVDDEPVDQEFIDLLLANDATYAPTLIAGLNWGRAVLAVATGEAAALDDPNMCVDQQLFDRINDPTALQPALEERTGGRVSPFAMGMIGAGREEVIMAQNLRTVRNAGGHIVMATDAGNPLTLHGPSVYNEMEAMEAAGMTPDEIIHAATLAGAQTMGLAEEIGTLEAGKSADLIVLSEDPRQTVRNFRSLTQVMRKGVLKTQEELRVR
ncbi:amidohydrolase family protein [Altererythrobacter sp. MF3-039]|uniref:amidohydrolase family protein n=1 Tax=Altererythrobacter sp. MF3-039 TaxID=3252901 RepID=UPI00390CAE2C